MTVTRTFYCNLCSRAIPNDKDGCGVVIGLIAGATTAPPYKLTRCIDAERHICRPCLTFCHNVEAAPYFGLAEERHD